LRLESYRRATAEVGCKRFWTVELGVYSLVGITSSLVALPVYAPEILPEERAGWDRLREEHLGEIRRVFEALHPSQRVLLFVHDPTALPFLAQEETVRRRLGQIERRWSATCTHRCSCGLALSWPACRKIRFLGNTVRRYSTALRRARDWEGFKLQLCPSLSGIQLLKDGGFLQMELDPRDGNHCAAASIPCPGLGPEERLV